MFEQIIEAIYVIEASNLSRSDLAKFQSDPYTLGFVEDCRFNGKPLCSRKHKHCLLTSR